MDQAIGRKVESCSRNHARIALLRRRGWLQAIQQASSLKESPIKHISIVGHEEIGLLHDDEGTLEEAGVVKPMIFRIDAIELRQRETLRASLPEPLVAETGNESEIRLERIDANGLKVPDENSHLIRGLTVL